MTECSHCSRKFKTFEDYARHILDKHFDDEIRVSWANEVLRPENPCVEEQPPNEIDESLRAILRPEVFEKLRKK